MLLRQKVLLAILESIDKPLNPTSFIKLAFLLREESCLAEYCVYYDFVPYKFGPFSFALYRELEALRRDGYVATGDIQMKLADTARSQTQEVVNELPQRMRREISMVVARHSRQSQKQLLKSVYERFPWYTINSELVDLLPKKKTTRPIASPAVYTIGYEGKSIDRFYDDLIQAGIERVLDVRCNPVSRKYGFAGRSLKDIGSKLGLNYVHMPELGISSRKRANLNEEGVLKASELIVNEPSALVCMERDVRCCHRSRLANIIATRTGLSVVHL